ncbi:MAG TPA: GGDEF domain-containing protein [Micromonosporaceae bacterium]
MDTLSFPAAEAGAATRVSDGVDELARLRATVAWLEAERETLRWALGHDELTGLANRRLLYSLAPTILGTGQPTVVVVLDLNGFKPINDTFGHGTGDKVLCVVAERLASWAGQNLVARLGGDEFAAVFSSPKRDVGELWWRPVVAALSSAIAEPMAVAGRCLTVTASVGVAPAHGDVCIDELLHRADMAMYQAKATGSGHVALTADAAGPIGQYPRWRRRDRQLGNARRARAATPIGPGRQGMHSPADPVVIELPLSSGLIPRQPRQAPSC